MKRFFSILLFCALLFLLGTGCTGEKTPESETAESTGDTQPEAFEKEVIRGEITGMKYQRQLLGYQDGAIYGDYAFNFRPNGTGYLHNYATGEYISSFKLPGTLQPHVNSASFSHVFVEETDEFPLLYLNVYNNYSGQEDPKWGTVLAYRIVRQKSRVTAELKQIVRIGFVNTDLWTEAGDRLPFGNFVVDTDRNRLIAFDVRDKIKSTRFFEFTLPDLSDGTFSPADNCNEVVLLESDILNWFDVEHTQIIQGACYRDGRIYSAEGMGSEKNPSRIRIIDLKTQSTWQDYIIRESEDLIPLEAEFIDFYRNTLIYGDVKAQMYEMSMK